MDPLADWNARQYLKFADERTRAAHDLLAQVPLDAPKRVYDLGCGPGNSTALLIERFPQAEVIGIDSSPEMLAAARKACPSCEFIEADLARWRPEKPADLLFANAVFQWLPDHPVILRRLLEVLPPGGVLAAQMPDNLYEPSHALMRETAADGPWAERLSVAAQARGGLPSAQAYYDLLKPAATRVDIWHTIYNHPLDGAPAIIEWLKATGLRPFLNALSPEEQSQFLADYTKRIARAYPLASDGKALLRFPRLFIVAVR